ncbi:DUF2470 domain-containing protein [Streptomyces omiyaensis]|uniref:DUF2470 domain-containing protein n=1 Tax=Streptomyces omiyaensis TaxID=68247 RepID=A0ABW7C2D2_9ACTN|nr:DUF2470 domain-containing protein [Streptomyces omiyaensis]GGY55502.1 hypothetical protein GCM10010363_41190 [Streptomyces omiyaensis]
MSAVPSPALPQQTAAEQVRSVLARALSLSLTLDGRTYDLLGAHTIGARGRITLHPPADTPLTDHLAASPAGGVEARVDLTDIAPTALRDRVRARVALTGRLAPATPGDPGSLRLDLTRVTLRTGTGTTEVAPGAYTLASPDPLALEEAALLTHLADAHPDLVSDLVFLAGSRLPHGVVRALPLAMDRHAVTLRCEYGEGHCDLRLLFPAEARDAAAAGDMVRRLLTAPRCAHHHDHH